MRFLVDQDVPDEISRLLEHWGHDVTLLREVLPITTLDKEVVAYACQQQLVMVTCNRDDFLALTKEIKVYSGLIILIRRRTRQMECARLYKLLTRADEAGIVGNINFA